MANTKITASLLDPAQTSITSLGTLSALTISGNLTVDTSTLKVDSSNNRVGVGTASPQALFHAAATNTTVWPFTSAQSGTYSYTPYPHELVVDNDTTGNEGSFASVFFSAGADSDGSKIATARIGAVETGNYKADLVFGTRNTSFQERMRIAAGGNVGIGVNSPGAILSLPAGESNTPRFAIESAVDDNDFTITQYEDGNGTYTLLGQNVKLNSGGNNTVLDSAHRTAGIVLDARNHGAITFITGAANTATEHVKIDSSGRVGIHETDPDYNLHISNASQVGLRIDGSGSGYVQGSILLSSAASGSNAYRGHGIFYWNNESETEWFLGAPYTDSDRFVINRKASQSTADFSSAYIHASHGQNFLTIENDGKVGIGSTNPHTFLHIKGSKSFAATEEHLKIENTATGEPVVLSMMTVADNGGVGNEGAIYFDAGATGVVNDNLLQLSANHQNTTTPQVTIKGDGTVGIGTTSPKRMLQVGDNTQAIAALSLQTTTSGLSRIYMGENDSTSREYSGLISYVQADDRMEFYTNTAIRAAIDTSGRVLIGGQTSHASGYSTPGANSGENAHYSKLEVQGNTYATTGDGRITLSSGTAWPSSGTQIGAIYFSSAWGGDHAAITSQAGGAVGNTDYPGELRFHTTADGTSTLSERLRIKANGVLIHMKTTDDVDTVGNIWSSGGQVYSSTTS